MLGGFNLDAIEGEKLPTFAKTLKTGDSTPEMVTQRAEQQFLLVLASGGVAGGQSTRELAKGSDPRTDGNR